MKNSFLFIVWASFLSLPTSGQDITRHDVDSMTALLSKPGPPPDRINTLLTLAQFHIFKTGERQIDFDSATVHIEEARKINSTLKSPEAEGYLLLTESFMMREKGLRDDAKKMTEKAVGILEKGKNKSYLGKAYYELGQYCNWRESEEKLYEMIKWVEKAVGAFKEARNLERKAFSLTMLGDLHSIIGNYDQAINALTAAIGAYDSIHYKQMQGVYSLLGRIYIVKGEHRKALQYELLALKDAEINKDSGMLCPIQNNLGNLYNSLAQYDMALKFYKASLEIAKKQDDPWNVVPLVTSTAQQYTALGQPENALAFLESVPKKYLDPPNNELKILINIPYLRAYISNRKFDKARPHAESLLKLIEVKGTTNETKSTVYRTTANYYINVKNYPAARALLEKHDKIINGLGPFRQALGYEAWSLLESAEGNYRGALNHLIMQKKINDSIFNAAKARQLQQLEIEYQTAKKEDSIKLKDQDILILTEKNNVQQANLRQARTVKNFTIGGIILAAIIIGLLYRQYRVKQRTNEVITQKNEQLQHLVTEKDWLVKEIHHRVKNNLQTVMGLLGTQSGYLKNEEAINAITDSQHRIQSMSLIHQRLYRSNNLSAIKMPDYIHELVDSLSDSFNRRNHIRFHVDVDPVELDLAHCIPLGLILNEAITNSFKYAFPNNRQGVISIDLTAALKNSYSLTIKDNGIGLPPGFDAGYSNSMGMNLMKGLCEELGATFAINGENGTRIDINFTFDREAVTGTAELQTETAHLL